MKNRVDYSNESKYDIIDIRNYIQKATLLGKRKQLHDLSYQKSLNRDLDRGNPFTWYRNSYNEIKNDFSAPVVRELSVKVTVSLKKGQDMDKVESAIIKGIYYGLDIRRIANPTDILSIEF